MVSVISIIAINFVQLLIKIITTGQAYKVVRNIYKIKVYFRYEFWRWISRKFITRKFHFYFVPVPYLIGWPVFTKYKA